MLNILFRKHLRLDDSASEQSTSCEYKNGCKTTAVARCAEDFRRLDISRTNQVPCRCYRRTSLVDLRPDPEAFHKPSYAPTLHAMVARVVAQEGPVRDRVLVERIARAHGIGRTDEPVRRRILAQARWTA